MIAEQADLFSLVHETGAWIYICGDAASMG